MRILVVSYFFPPYNCIGAVRVGKTVKALTALGHEVRVVTARDQALPLGLDVEIPEERIVRTRWLNVNAPVEMLLGGRKRVATKGFSVARQGGSSVLATLGDWYRRLIHLPDGQIGWLPFAYRAALGLAVRWRPDVIFASGTPYTSLIAASRVSRRLGIPWVAELRDLWTDNPYINRPRWLRALEARVERRVLGSASALVTVSPPLAETLGRKYPIPVAVVTNAFDPEEAAEVEEQANDSTLEILYTGIIYPGRRDPSPLFEALKLLGPRAAMVKVTFVGRYLQIAADLARAAGVESCVAVRDPVSHREALRLQAAADVLLLLLWDDPQEKGTFTGKLFEYFGARRPILAIGPDDNVASQLIASRQLGTVSRDPRLIADRLAAWLDLKKAEGRLPGIPPESIAEFSRIEQTRLLEAELKRAGRLSKKGASGGRPDC